MQTVELLRRIAEQIRPVSKDETLYESKLMLASLIGTDPGAVSPFSDISLNDRQQAALRSAVSRRREGYPLQYILGEWSFMGLMFYTDPCALIPRGDTEFLAETAVKIIREKNGQTALDLCAGTGCIGISLAKLTGISVTLTDIDPDCCELIRTNAARNGVSVSVCRGDMFQAVPEGKYDLIVSNPPYIPSDTIPLLERELSYEPLLALDGGEDGLDFYRVIADQYRDRLNPGGTLLMEIGYDQAESVPKLFHKGRVLTDYGGNPRVVWIERDDDG